MNAYNSITCWPGENRGSYERLYNKWGGFLVSSYRQPKRKHNVALDTLSSDDLLLTSPSWLCHYPHSASYSVGWLPARIIVMRANPGGPNVALRSHANQDVTWTVTLARYIIRVFCVLPHTKSNVWSNNMKTTHTQQEDDFISRLLNMICFYIEKFCLLYHRI
jgi:hypothetical protein